MNLVVALRAEAQPLIEYFQLEAGSADGLFTIYRGESVWLVISGVGRVLAGAAVAHLHLVSGGKADVPWLNVGIAGHRQLSIGDLLLASRIVEPATGRSWYPPYTLDSAVQRSELVTVDQPERDFPRCSAYDMEAAGFYAIASRCSTSELVQSLKVVSDNPGTTLDLSHQQISQLIADQLESIATVGGELTEIGRQHKMTRPTTPSLDRYLGQWHFTVTQRHRLTGLLRRWAVLNNNDPWAGLTECRGSVDVLQHLEWRLEQQPIRFSPHQDDALLDESPVQDP
ncbi:MAG: hypothetical protein VX249_07815 [Pseudomonadota bacterium]|nr:hypothetical protein [Pseudomonadota bacterium]